jgi:hypothetical protein
MNMVPIISSNLVAVGYDVGTGTLRIQFRSGTYDYYVVPASIHQGLMSALSHGEYHAAHIKNSYRFRKI